MLRSVDLTDTGMASSVDLLISLFNKLIFFQIVWEKYTGMEGATLKI